MEASVPIKSQLEKLKVENPVKYQKLMYTGRLWEILSVVVCLPTSVIFAYLYSNSEHWHPSNVRYLIILLPLFLQATPKIHGEKWTIILTAILLFCIPAVIWCDYKHIPFADGMAFFFFSSFMTFKAADIVATRKFGTFEETDEEKEKKYAQAMEQRRAHEKIENESIIKQNDGR
jgi:hypothetical protein